MAPRLGRRNTSTADTDDTQPAAPAGPLFSGGPTWQQITTEGCAWHISPELREHYLAVVAEPDFVYRERSSYERNKTELSSTTIGDHYREIVGEPTEGELLRQGYHRSTVATMLTMPREVVGAERWVLYGHRNATEAAARRKRDLEDLEAWRQRRADVCTCRLCGDLGKTNALYLPDPANPDSGKHAVRLCRPCVDAIEDLRRRRAFASTSIAGRPRAELAEQWLAEHPG